MAVSFTANANYAPSNGTLDFWNDKWIQFADDDGETNPGYGSQDFDAEYFFYKYDATTNDLSIGLQTGFDVSSGKVTYKNKDYYAGDLALSFDGVDNSSRRSTSNSYEYAVDFGKLTKTYWGDDVESKTSGGDNGIDQAGLYKVNKNKKGNLLWDNDIYYKTSVPYVMDEGTYDRDIYSESGKGTVDGQQSYYRTVTFNLDGLVNDASQFTLDAHWTMSCGNDNINGNVDIQTQTAKVPEPTILALFGIGLLGMATIRRSKRK